MYKFTFIYVISISLSIFPQIFPNDYFLRDKITDAIVKVKSPKFRNYEKFCFDSLLSFEITKHNDSFQIILQPIPLHLFEGCQVLIYSEEYSVPSNEESIMEFEKHSLYEKIKAEEEKFEYQKILIRIRDNFNGLLTYHDSKEDVEKKLKINLGQNPQQGQFGCAYCYQNKYLVFSTCRVPFLVDIVDSLQY